MSGHVLPQGATGFSLQIEPEIETFGRAEVPGILRGLQQWQQRQECVCMRIKICLSDATTKLQQIESDCSKMNFAEERLDTAGGMPSDCLRHHSQDTSFCLACFPGLYTCVNTGICCPLTAVVWLWEAAVHCACPTGCLLFHWLPHF